MVGKYKKKMKKAVTERDLLESEKDVLLQKCKEHDPGFEFVYDYLAERMRQQEEHLTLPLHPDNLTRPYSFPLLHQVSQQVIWASPWWVSLYCSFH